MGFFDVIKLLLTEADWKELLVAMINPVYGPMMLWMLFGFLVSDLEKLFGKH